MSVHSWFERCLALQPFELRLDLSGDAVLVYINVRGANAERAGHFPDRPLLEHIEVEHLKLFRLEVRFHASERGVPEVFRPLRLLDRIEVQTLRIGDPLNRRCAFGLVG